jgi:hypothetical protein
LTIEIENQNPKIKKEESKLPHSVPKGKGKIKIKKIKNEETPYSSLNS